MDDRELSKRLEDIQSSINFIITKLKLINNEDEDQKEKKYNIKQP